MCFSLAVGCGMEGENCDERVQGHLGRWLRPLVLKHGLNGNVLFDESAPSKKTAFRRFFVSTHLRQTTQLSKLKICVEDEARGRRQYQSTAGQRATYQRLRWTPLEAVT